MVDLSHVDHNKSALESTEVNSDNSPGVHSPLAHEPDGNDTVVVKVCSERPIFVT